MHNALGPGTVLGYCTNVHAGADYAQMRSNLERHTLAVKQAVSPREPMGVGLWLSATTARELIERDKVRELGDWLGEHGLFAYTFNGFPYGDFHQPVVKYAVYEPDWSDPARLAYTLDLASILTRLLPEGGEGSISTLPLGWPRRGLVNDSSVATTIQAPFHPRQAVKPLQALAEQLRRLEAETGRYIHVNLEPEPGCFLDTADDVVQFFEDHLLPGSDEPAIRRHLGVCHDLCHSEVMFEDQREVLNQYRRAGILVGKVQISAAVRVCFDALNPGQQQQAWQQLKNLPEPRYLHQTSVKSAPYPEGPEALRLYDDLPEALQDCGGASSANLDRLESRSHRPATSLEEWRVHFHVPLFLERFGQLQTTSDGIKPALDDAVQLNHVRHFEAETYAWNVLPEDLRKVELADGIAQELTWVKSLFA